MWSNSSLHGRRPPSINGYGFRLIQTEMGSVVRWLRRKLYDLSEIHNLTERSCPKIYANLYYIQNRDPKILKLNDHFA